MSSVKMSQFNNYTCYSTIAETLIEQMYTVFRVSRVTFFPANRVEHQKLNQTTPYGAVWLSFWCSTRPSADEMTN